MKTANWQNKDRRIQEITRRSEALSVLCKQISIVGELFEVMVDWMELETAEVAIATRDLNPTRFDTQVKPQIDKAVEDWEKYTVFGTNKPEPVQHFTDKELKLLE